MDIESIFVHSNFDNPCEINKNDLMINFVLENLLSINTLTDNSDWHLFSSHSITVAYQ